MLEKLKSQEQEKCALQEKINRLSKLILDSSSVGSSHVFESMMRRNHRSKTKDVDDSDSMIADVPDISNSFPDLDDEEISKISVSGDSVDNILDEEKSNNVQKKVNLFFMYKYILNLFNNIFRIRNIFIMEKNDLYYKKQMLYYNKN